MDYGAIITTIKEYKHTCDECNAKISVLVAKQLGLNEREDYNCP